MKILETVFFILMIALPGFFVILGLANIKRVKKNKKFRTTLLKMILITFLIPGIIWGGIKMTNNKNSNGGEPKEVENDTPKKDPDVDPPKQNEPSTPSENNPEKPSNPTNPNTGGNKPTGGNTTTNGKTSKGYTIETRDGVTYIDGYLVVNKTYPLPQEYVPTNTHKTVGNNSICQDCIIEDAYTAYTKMKNDASAQGLNIWIASGYRSYSYQNALYTGYVKRSGKEAADTYSARAGHSEHQSGYAFDLNSVTDAFANTKEGKWVNENCYKYGFIIRYPKGKDNETGYKYESWHLRYVGVDLASKLYNAGDWITMETYFGITSQYATN